MGDISHPSLGAAAGVSARPVFVLALSLMAMTLAVLLLYLETARSMLSVWLKHDTYQYGLLVLPVFFWLLWRLRAPLLAVPYQPAWWAPGAALLSGASWLAGELADANALRHLALVLMLVFALVSVLGRQRARLALFPLSFLFFAVPFGESVVPTLMDWTADATVLALRLSGVPVYREGLWFVLPSGSWSVIEACSGVKFLLTSVFVGSLFAYLMYRSNGRRALFLAAAIAVALLANWMRAYFVVLLGHVSDNRLMGDRDHVVFGWILFAMAVIALFWIGSRFAQSPVHVSANGKDRAAGASTLLAATLALVSVALWPWLADRIEVAHPGSSTVAPLPVVAVGDWTEVDGRLSAWEPALVGARRVTVQRFRSGASEVELHVAMFENQHKGAELATSLNRLVRYSDPVWRLASMTELAVESSVLPSRVRSARVRTGDRTYVVWHWMISGGRPTLSLLKGKADLVQARLFERPDRAYWVALLVPVNEDRPDAAEVSARRFIANMESSLAQALEIVP